MRKLGTVKFPGYLSNIGTVDGGTQLHVFHKTSQVGFVAVTDVRVNASLPYCQLLFSKSRVAPLKTANILPLELAAAKPTVRIYHAFEEEARIKFHKTYIWTGSFIVL